ncbi:hypothetical protein TeGR_g9964, partial [Tetraparma gracilis]
MDSTPPPNPPNPPNPPTLPTTYPEPGIAVVSLANPDPTVESSTSPHGTKVCEHRLSPPTVLALYETLLLLEDKEDVSCVILTGGDGRFFCNGFDLKYIHAHSSEGGLVDDLQQATEMLMAKILKYKKVTVAAVNGHAA